MKLVLVTGSSRGIGAAIAKRYAARPDTTVLINYRADKDGAEKTAAEIAASGGTAAIYQADVSSAASVKAMAEAIDADFSGAPLSTLVNNAGRIIRPAGWLEATDDDIELTVRTNFLPVLWTARAFAPAMLASGTGHIVNISTTYSVNGAAPAMAYTAAKAAVNAVTTALAAEMGASGVRVNSVAPGNVWTQMAEEAGDDLNNWAISTTPLGRLGEPDEIAAAVEFLEDASFVTGHTILVDGGQILKI